MPIIPATFDGLDDENAATTGYPVTQQFIDARVGLWGIVDHEQDRRPERLVEFGAVEGRGPTTAGGAIIEDRQPLGETVWSNEMILIPGTKSPFLGFATAVSHGRGD